MWLRVASEWAFVTWWQLGLQLCGACARFSLIGWRWWTERANYYSAHAAPFDWRFTRHDLQRQLRALAHNDWRVTPLAPAA